MKIHSWILLTTIFSIPTHIAAANWAQYVTPFLEIARSENCLCVPEQFVSLVGHCVPEISTDLTVGKSVLLGAMSGVAIDLVALYIDNQKDQQKNQIRKIIAKKIADHFLVLPTLGTVLGLMAAAYWGIGI